MKKSKKFRRIKWALKNAHGRKKKRLRDLFERLYKFSTLVYLSLHKKLNNDRIDDTSKSSGDNNRGKTAKNIELSVIRGTKSKSTNYFDANRFLYTRNNSMKNKNIYLVCKNSVGWNCPARAVIRNNDLQNVVLTKGHNHHGDKKAVDRLTFSRTLQRICEKNPTLSPLKCYVEAKNKLKGKVERKNIPMISSFFSLMYRSQKLKVPLLPKNFEQFESLIAQAKNHKRYVFDDAGELFYRGDWKGKTGSNLAFVSERTLQRVSKQRNVTLLMDGTFRAVPRHMGFRQLYIINVIIKGRCFPLSYILMERKDFKSYMTVFTELKKLIPSMNVVECMSDYESATRKAILKQFPGVNLLGCYFHYVQAIMKVCKRFGLLKREDADKFQATVNKVVALALLPNNYITRAFDYICKSAPESQRWNRFRTYFENQWIKANISVYGVLLRTNNYCETLNRNINKLVEQKGPNIWKLILTLQTVEMLKSDELEQIDGPMPKVRQSKKTIAFEKKVKAATEQFDQTDNFEELIDFMSFNEDLAKALNIQQSDLNHSDEDDNIIIPNHFNAVSEFRKAHPRKGAVYQHNDRIIQTKSKDYVHYKSNTKL